MQSKTVLTLRQANVMGTLKEDLLTFRTGLPPELSDPAVTSVLSH
jgi:hypothetical protein